MPYIKGGYTGPIYHWNGVSIFAESDWTPVSYTFDADSIAADTYGVKHIYPGTLAVYNAATYMAERATADHVAAGTYDIFPISAFHNATHGNPTVDCVLRGVLVERYCAGLVGTDGLPTYGGIPAAVKTRLPAVLWKNG